MGKIIGLNGQSLSRQPETEQSVEWARELHQLYMAVDFLLQQIDVTREVFKTLGVTKEQLHDAEERVKAEYIRQADGKC